MGVGVAVVHVGMHCVWGVSELGDPSRDSPLKVEPVLAHLGRPTQTLHINAVHMLPHVIRAHRLNHGMEAYASNSERGPEGLGPVGERVSRV